MTLFQWIKCQRTHGYQSEVQHEHNFSLLTGAFFTSATYFGGLDLANT